MDGFSAVFEGLDDRRTGNAARHDLLEVLLIALCTVLCGGQTAVDMAEFAEAKEEFLREFLTLAKGLPSHDTFSRILRPPYHAAHASAQAVRRLTQNACGRGARTSSNGSLHGRLIGLNLASKAVSGPA